MAAWSLAFVSAVLFWFKSFPSVEAQASDTNACNDENFSNVIVQCGSTEGCTSKLLLSQKQPTLPDNAALITHGSHLPCADGHREVVVASALSLKEHDAFFASSTMLRQATIIFLNWLNHERAHRRDSNPKHVFCCGHAYRVRLSFRCRQFGLQINGHRYEMQFVWVDDSSSAEQVTHATFSLSLTQQL